MQWPSPNYSPHAQTLPVTAPPFRLATTPYRKCLPLPMTSHYRNHRTFAGQTESPSRKCMGRRKRGSPITRSLASHRLPHPCLPALAGQCIRLRPNGMAVRGSSVLGLTGMRSFVRVGVVERAMVVAQRQPVRANATGYRTSIPFGHHAISKTLALADDIALSEPPDICGPNGISVSQVYGVTEERVSDSAFPCESGVPFGVSSLASHRLPRPSLPALAGHSLRFSAKRNGGARVVSAVVDDSAVVRQGRGCRMCSDRHSTTAHTRKRHRTPHLHSVWPPRHIENACPCR